MRLFVAVPVPSEIQTYLHSIQKLVGGSLMSPRVTWTGEFHITLQFLGECTVSQGALLKKNLAEIRFEPFSLTIKNMDIFKNNSDTVLWIGLQESKHILDLSAQVRYKTTELGFQAEKDFIPHVTVARIRGGGIPAEVINEIKALAIQPASFSVNQFMLMQSTQTRDGSVYSTLATFLADQATV